jgi:hypothetical protein
VLLDELSLNYAVPFASWRSLACDDRRASSRLPQRRRRPVRRLRRRPSRRQARFSRPLFENVLGQEWLPGSRGARALQEGGASRTSPAARGARASPSPARIRGSHVDGIDSDRASIEAAERVTWPGATSPIA